MLTVFGGVGVPQAPSGASNGITLSTCFSLNLVDGFGKVAFALEGRAARLRAASQLVEQAADGYSAAKKLIGLHRTCAKRPAIPSASSALAASSSPIGCCLRPKSTPTSMLKCRSWSCDSLGLDLAAQLRIQIPGRALLEFGGRADKRAIGSRRDIGIDHDGGRFLAAQQLSGEQRAGF